MDASSPAAATAQELVNATRAADGLANGQPSTAPQPMPTRPRPERISREQLRAAEAVLAHARETRPLA